MEGNSNSVDLTFLLGQTVEQVCLGQHQTQVRFAEASLLIECKHAIVIPSEQREIVWELYHFPSDGISKLLGHTVSGASFTAERTLELWFSSGIRLLVLGESDQQECFQIVCGDLWVAV